MVGEVVPTTLTLKNIPDEVYERLKASAAEHRRSLNSEAIVCLEAALMPRRVSVEERLERAREFAPRLQAVRSTPEEIDAFKREGRSVIVVDANILAYLYTGDAGSTAALSLLEA